MAFIPDQYTKSSADKAYGSGRKEKAGRSTRNYHDLLSLALQPLIDLQKEKPLMYVRIGDKVKLVRLLLPVMVILGDGKSNDVPANIHTKVQIGLLRCVPCLPLIQTIPITVVVG